MIWLVVIAAICLVVILLRFVLNWDPYPARTSNQPSSPFRDRVSRRAHQLWLDEGQPSGQAERHWATAETIETVLKTEHGTDASITPHIERLQFVCDLAEVQILLDYLSGQSQLALLQGPEDDPAQNKDVRPDLAGSVKNPRNTKLLTVPDLQKLADIRFPPDKGKEANAADAVLLMRLRDQLNQLAFPASGLTLAFTLLIWTPYLSSVTNDDKWARWHLARQAYPLLERSAYFFRRLAFSFVAIAFILTGFTLWMSNTVADGALKLARIDGLKQERVKLSDPASTGPTTGSVVSYPAVETHVAVAESALRQWWADWEHTPLMRARCWLIETASGSSTECRPDRPFEPYQVASSQEPGVASPPNATTTATELDDLAADVIAGLLGTWLPVLWAAIGSLVVTARTVYWRIRTCTLTPSDIWLLPTRLILGVMAGTSIGLFFAPTGAAVRTNTAIGTLSLSAIAFLAGYAVDGLFQLLDEIKDRLFRATSETTDAKPATRSA